MKAYLENPFGLDHKRSIWIGEDELGKEKVIMLKNKRHVVVMPHRVDTDVVIRCRGLGKTKNNKTGDLLLHVWLNKGDDINNVLWLSESSARNGSDKRLLLKEKKITMVVPPQSYNGLTVRLKGYGKDLDVNWQTAFLRRKKGNALVKLIVYPDTITPRYGSFELLTTEDMALEGWVYRKIEEVVRKLGRTGFPIYTIRAGEVADQFNESGWRGIFHMLVQHLQLDHLNLELTRSSSITAPGLCQRTVIVQNNKPVGYKYRITINEKFLDNPFAIAAILAHELCHVIYSERISEEPISLGYILKSEKGTLEEEHTIDLLVFMFRIGEFQLRVARDTRLTFGYFDQEIFERMQVFVSKKLNSILGYKIPKKQGGGTDTRS